MVKLVLSFRGSILSQEALLENKLPVEIKAHRNAHRLAQRQQFLDSGLNKEFKEQKDLYVQRVDDCKQSSRPSNENDGMNRRTLPQWNSMQPLKMRTRRLSSLW